MTPRLDKSILQGQTPEQRELEKKLSELAALETELTQRELELATLQAELRTFEAQYLSIIGVRYAELDEITARLAEVQAYLNPDDRTAQTHAARARTQAQESAHAVGNAQGEPQQHTFVPSEGMRKLYRDVAKRIHPDLTTNEQERIRRERLMAEANGAYERGDEARLRAILHEWESSPEAVNGDGIGAELIRAIRKIAQVEARLRVINTEMAPLKTSDLYQLKTKKDEVEAKGRDLLSEMAAHLDQEIVTAWKRLEALTLRMTSR